jgi:hypothetical protein
MCRDGQRIDMLCVVLSGNQVLSALEHFALRGIGQAPHTHSNCRMDGPGTNASPAESTLQQYVPASHHCQAKAGKDISVDGAHADFFIAKPPCIEATKIRAPWQCGRAAPPRPLKMRLFFQAQHVSMRLR